MRTRGGMADSPDLAGTIQLEKVGAVWRACGDETALPNGNPVASLQA